MERKIEQLSRVFNLTKYEAKLYLAALNFKYANLTELARKANIPRTAAYAPIKKLLKEGFLSIFKKEKRIYYKAEDPKNLHYILDRKRVDLEDVISYLEKKN